MKLLEKTLATIGIICLITVPAQAQNWVLTVKDNASNTAANQVNGISGGTATLFCSILNFTGTAASDDGTGIPASATALDFAGFGFSQQPAQYDLGNLFTMAAPGYPQVFGSTDGSTPGTSGYVILGTFDLSTLAPGTYTEDFTAGAFPDDATSTVPFSDITGTLTLQVNNAPVPEASTATSLSLGILPLLLLAGYRRVKRTGQSV